VLRTDGGARGNPGPAGAGFVLERDGEVVVRGGAFLGETTNNIAEYEALIWGLENAADAGASNLIAYADSELVVKQMTGEYKVKHAGLKPLFARARDLSRALGHVDFVHVRREDNRLADELANEAMDAMGYTGDPLLPRVPRIEQETLFE
jgi:ribonuclease HI